MFYSFKAIEKTPININIMIMILLVYQNEDIFY